MNDSAWDAAGISQHDRLSALAASANETARMARVNVSLTLIVALYLTLSLLSATDENLFLNALVTLPQLQTGVSLEQSYLFAPTVFLYLHVQTLFFLIVLARKVRRFEAALAVLFPDDSVAKDECRDWLSAISLVQALQSTGTFGFVSRMLVWVATTGVPLALFVLIDTSFLRYQSTEISVLHHICLITDLICVLLFWRQLASHSPRLRLRDVRSLFRPVLHDKKVLKADLLFHALKRFLALSGAIVLAGTILLFSWPIAYDEKIRDLYT